MIFLGLGLTAVLVWIVFWVWCLLRAGAKRTPTPPGCGSWDAQEAETPPGSPSLLRHQVATILEATKAETL